MFRFVVVPTLLLLSTCGLAAELLSAPEVEQPAAWDAGVGRLFKTSTSWLQ